MSTGSLVNAIAHQLHMVLSEVRQASLNLLAKGRAPSMANPADAPYFERLEGWAERVRSLAGQLARLQSNLEGEQNFLPIGGRTQEARNMAFRAHQSVSDQRAAVENAQTLAAQVSQALERLLDRSINPGGQDRERLASELAKTGIDFTNKLAELEKKIGDAERLRVVDNGTAGQLRAAVGAARTQYISAPRGAAAPAPDYIGMATLLLTLLRILWLERLRSSRTRSP